MKYCTDNAAMIGAAGYYAYKLGRISGLDLNAKANDELKKMIRKNLKTVYARN